jgi:hypothetical protein
VSLDERQLRSLTRDLLRAAAKRQILLYLPLSWWRRLRRAARQRSPSP